jgi:glutamine cyclotransferase
VSYKINDKQVSESFATNDLKLGVQTLTATISYDDTTADVSTKITVLNNTKPKIYTYKIVNTYPHDITSYTQGLEFYNGELYESTGQYRESKLRKVDYKTAEVLKNINLQSQYFGEGLTVLNDKIYQLTWRENTGFVYDVNSFEKLSSFTYGKSNEGWGLCNDGTRIFKSDGTENIWLLNPETLAEEETIQVYREKGKVVGLNELEWVNGKIYSNLYQFNGVAIINPKNGAMEAVIDFSPLRKLVTQHQGLDVLNGIAYNPDTNTLFVTGKRWDKLFEVEIIEQ